MLIHVPATHSTQFIIAPTVPSVQLSSMKAATKDFHENNIIGRGGFGIVYEVCLYSVGRLLFTEYLSFC